MNDIQPTPMPAPPTTVMDLVSTANGRRYRLQVTPPATPAPPGGHPVLWLLDGQGYNGFVTDLVRNRGCIGAEITPALVVAVGYPSDDIAQFLCRRSLDLTPTPGDGQHLLADLPGHAFGGLDGFLDTLTRDMLPLVAACFAVDRSEMALLGHSFGGLATLYALFTRPAMFRSFIALSPSIWWDGRVLLRHEAAFAEQVRAGTAAPRLFIGVGGAEQDPPVPRPGMPPDLFGKVQAAAAAARMVDNAAELAARLQALSGRPDYRVRYECAPGETHMTTPFVTAGHALDLAFPPAHDAL